MSKPDEKETVPLLCVTNVVMKMFLGCDRQRFKSFLFPRGDWNPPLLPHQRVSKANLPPFLEQLLFLEDKRLRSNGPKKKSERTILTLTNWLKNSSMVVSLLNILVFYIMLLSHSLKHTSQPAGCTVRSSLSDQMKCGADSTENSSPSLSAAPPAPQKQTQPTGREFPRETRET